MILSQRKWFARRWLAKVDSPYRAAVLSCEPLDHLLECHQRLRTVGGMMTGLADDLWRLGRERDALAILDFFNEEWPLHLDDEEYSLMPRLLACLSGRTGHQQQMTMEHNHDLVRQAVLDIGPGLCAISNGKTPAWPAAFAAEVMRAEELLMRHIEWEEQTIYRLARKRLGQSESAAIWREMVERRGINHLC